MNLQQLDETPSVYLMNLKKNIAIAHQPTLEGHKLSPKDAALQMPATDPNDLNADIKNIYGNKFDHLSDSKAMVQNVYRADAHKDLKIKNGIQLGQNAKGGASKIVVHLI